MVHFNGQEVETYCEAPRSLVSELSPKADAASAESQNADDPVQTYVGAHDDDEKTAVHDARTQMEACYSSSYVSY